MKDQQQDDGTPVGGDEPQERRSGAVVLRDGMNRWVQQYPVYAVVKVNGVDEPFVMSGPMTRVAEKIDQIKAAMPTAKFAMVGFGTDQGWARSKGEEV